MSSPGRRTATTEGIARRGPILDLRPDAPLAVAAPLPRPVRPAPRVARPHGPKRTMDGRIIRRLPSGRPSRAAAMEAVTKIQRAQRPRTSNRLLYYGQYPLIAAIALGMAFSVDIGQILIVLYALFLIIRTRDSRGPFIVALVMLVAVPGFQLIGLATFSENAAIYAYELLVVGVVMAIIEAVKLGKNTPAPGVAPESPSGSMAKVINKR